MSYARGRMLMLLAGIVFMGLACDSGALEQRVAELEERNAELEQTIAAVERDRAELIAAQQASQDIGTAEPTMDMTMMDGETVQEVSIIENYAATRFFPRWIVVLKDVPVRMYLTRLHREHVNRFSIDPFYSSSEVILPGEIGLIEFVPDQVGAFKIRNVGHNFEADLVVVAT